MRSVARLRPNPPSRAKRNIRWAAIALIALSLLPAGSPDHDMPEEEATLAADAESTVGDMPWLADGGGLDSALDLGADAIPLE